MTTIDSVSVSMTAAERFVHYGFGAALFALAALIVVAAVCLVYDTWN